MRFEELFVGGSQAYGQYRVHPKMATTVTGKGPAPASAYQTHLTGGMGLGLVPIRLDGTCVFAAVDIDDDNIDHAKLYKEVQERKMPLSVCRSKSGGAHLYLFVKEPGIPASEVIPLLQKWARLLGFPNVEVFPKQREVSAKNTGNWINLPYHNVSSTTRYAFGPEGALNLEQFLASVVWYTGQEVVETLPVPERPTLEVPEGEGAVCGEGRNVALFKKASSMRRIGLSEEAILAGLRIYNQETYDPPLPEIEITTIAKSTRRYKKGSGEEVKFQKAAFAKLRKYTTDPPYYILEVNGLDLTLTLKEFESHPAVRSKVLAALDIVIAHCGPKLWDKQMMELLETKTDIYVPQDQASIPAQVIDLMHEFLALRQGAKIWDDVLRNMPYEVDGVVWFRPRAMIGHLQHRRLIVSPQHLSTILSGHGLYTKKWKIKGKEVELWGLPVERIIEQTEAFTPPVLDSEEESF